jgi:AraC family transcriptional regulator
MVLTPVIRTTPERKLIGKRLTMSLANNKTFDLWKSFMPRRNAITNTLDANLYSLQIYKEGYFTEFNPAAAFEKWAAVEVTGFEYVPEDMETLVLPAGRYAVFFYKGPPENGDEIFTYIFRDWLPASGHTLDNRPHFEVLGAKYKSGDPESEEEIWIPIQ